MSLAGLENLRPKIREECFTHFKQPSLFWENVGILFIAISLLVLVAK